MPATFRDRYEEALLAHLKAKQAGLPPQPKQSFAVPRRAINLMEALRRSIAEDKKDRQRSRKASASPGAQTGVSVRTCRTNAPGRRATLGPWRSQPAIPCRGSEP